MIDEYINRVYRLNDETAKLAVEMRNLITPYNDKENDIDEILTQLYELRILDFDHD